MPQIVISCPTASRNKCPNQAFLPSALGSRLKPVPVQIRYTVVARLLNGLSCYNTFGAADIADDFFFLHSGVGDYPIQARALDWAQNRYKLFKTQTSQLSDGRSQVSTIVAPGVAAVTGDFAISKYGDTVPVLINSPAHLGASNCDVDGDANAHYDQGTSALSGPVDVGGIISDVDSKSHQPFPNFDPSGTQISHYGWNEPSIAKGVGQQNPTDYDGSFGLNFGPGGGVIPALPFTCGFSIAGMTAARWRGQLKMPNGISPQPYTILRVQETQILEGGFTILAPARTQTQFRVDFISSGMIMANQVLGVDIPMPEPSALGLFNTIGPDSNPVLRDYYMFSFGGINSALKTLGLKMGNNDVFI